MIPSSQSIAIYVEDFLNSAPFTALTTIPLQFVALVGTAAGSCTEKPNLITPTPADGSVVELRTSEAYTAQIRARKTFVGIADP